MKILAISHDLPGADWKGREALLREEAQRVWTLQQADILREIWFTAGDRDAIILLETESVEAAEQILQTLPLARERLIEFTCRRLISYDGFERLFGPSDHPT